MIRQRWIGSFSGNGGTGIWALDSVVQGNSVFNNGGFGIQGYTSTILDNTSVGNSRKGILSGYSTVKNNLIKGNAEGGLDLSGNCLVDGNTAAYNSNFNMSACPTCTLGVNSAP